MFSRRHPYLFFILVFSSVSAAFILGTSILIVVSSMDSDLDFGEKVGVVEVSGVISESREIIEPLNRFRKDESIKAIVLRINSPGGGVGPSQEIYREIQKTIEKKKVIASMGGIAASGGYYIASATDGIVASPGTITGSIGVIMGFTNFQKLLEKVGLVPIVIKSGEFKDTGSPVREMTKEEREMLQGFVKRIHQQFVEDVAKGRKIDKHRVEAIADGRILTGEEAKALGLVDRIGNLEDAVAWAGKLGGIEGEVKSIYAKERKLSLLKYLMESSIRSIMDQIITQAPFAGYLYRPLATEAG
ncbi:MAG: signal peptidase [Deltaproteobacteria bacterium RBG_13_49_15]|nr:MAG: signal peptidase [Deltaproteobacteria bacterium RBG_13_49_15]